jgi:hypothetical protein
VTVIDGNGGLPFPDAEVAIANGAFRTIGRRRTGSHVFLGRRSLADGIGTVFSVLFYA